VSLTRIRGATPRDAAAVARVHTRAWEAAYRGLIADDVIRARASRRREDWELHLATRKERQHVLVAEDEDRIVGFATGGPSPDPDLDPATTAEVSGLYVDPDHWRRGIGRTLLAELIRCFHRDGFDSASLWVLAGNTPARSFYEESGWKLDGSERRHPQRRALEVRYRRELAQLSGAQRK
jgi:GNAT superfamily N-acetyltransferase